MTLSEDIKEIFDGQFTTYHDDYVIKEQGTFKNGYLSGKLSIYDDEGIIIEEHNYNEGDKDGISKYYKEGILISEKKYKKGTFIKSKYYLSERDFDYINDSYLNKRLNIVSSSYDNSTQGTLLSYYKNGKIKERFDGQSYTKFWMNGNIQLKQYFNNKVLNGICYNYYCNGELKEKKTYLNGKLNGPFDTFFSSGRIQIRSNYIDNVLCGLFEKFYSDGQLKETKQYIKGIVSGKHIEYYENGDISSIYTYKNHYRSTANRWNLEKKDEKSFYFSEQSISYKEFFFDNQIKHINYKKTNYNIDKSFHNYGILNYKTKESLSNSCKDSWVSYHKNGYIEFEKILDDDIEIDYDFTNSERIKKKNWVTIEEDHLILNKGQNGSFKNFYTDSKNIKEEGTYKKNKLDGVFNRFYKNGNIRETSFYIDGKLDGNYSLYSKKGKVLINEYYTNGLINGKSYHFNKKGTLTNFTLWNNGNIITETEYYPNNLPSKITKNDSEMEYQIIESFYFSGLIKRKEFYKNGEYGFFRLTEENYHENGMLKNKIGLVSQRELEKQEEQLAREEEHERATARFHDLTNSQYSDFYETGENHYCSRCHESPCMCSDPY